jgi:hypothetical protein
VKGLSKALREAKRIGVSSGVKIGRSCSPTHFLFVAYVLLFIKGNFIESNKLKEILNLYRKATGMKINMKKSSIFFNGLEVDDVQTPGI